MNGNLADGAEESRLKTYNSHYDDCQQRLEGLIQFYQQHLPDINEATTRLHLIDTLLFDCLGWDKCDVIPEEHNRTNRNEYTDYTFFAPRRMLLLEAKRAGITFVIPAGKTVHTYSIKSLCKGNDALRAAVDQVANYCQSRGVPLACISNGHQFVAFVACRNDGVPPLDGKALVFPSLSKMLERFAELWNMLSKPGIEDDNLRRRLLGTHAPELPPPLSASISGYPGTIGRNVFQADLKNMSELVIEDVPESPELAETFLRNCYSPSGALSQHSLASKAILRARYSAIFDDSSPDRPATMPATTAAGVSHELYAESVSRRPILLLGNVGVGKTMFIRHLVAIEARDLFQDAICLRIDLGSTAALASDLKEFVILEIARQLDANYDVKLDRGNFVRGVYDSELSEFANSIYGDLRTSDSSAYARKELEKLEELIANKSDHCRRSLEHLSKARRKQVVIFIDNADQRGDATQDEAFLIAQEIASTWPALVYVPLRPETFHRSVSSGALSGYHPKVFTVSPPRVDRVLDKRLRYALECTASLGQHAKASHIEAIELTIKSMLKSLHHDEDLEAVSKNGSDS